MKTVRVHTLACFLAVVGLCGAGLLNSEAHAYVVRSSSGGPVLSGELVVTDAIHNRFRLVGHGGSFTAPPGTAIDAWDGKPVQVELSSDGRVLQISEMPIHIEPITHGYEIVTGHLVADDPAGRTFTLAGSDRIYVPPSRIDVRPYAGRLVEVRLDEQGQVAEIDLAPRSSVSCPYNQSDYYDGETVCKAGTQFRCDNGSWRSLSIACPAALSSLPCDAEGLSYADGATHCNGGTQFICERGQWRNLGTICVSGDGVTTDSRRVCLVGGASVASGSSICRGGTTFRCADGQWVNLGTACS